MPVLTADQLAQDLDELSESQASQDVETLEHHLSNRSPRVRLSAANALARAGVGEDRLRKALTKERNEVVLAAICEALASVGGPASLPPLKRMTETHSSQLVRRYALIAIAEILGDEAIRYLRRRRDLDRSRRVKATADVLLLQFHPRDSEAIQRLRTHLASGDRIVRSIVVNMPRHYSALKASKDLRGLLDEVATADISEALRNDALATLASLGENRSSR